LGVRQDFLNQKASLIISVSDVLNSLKWTREIDTPILYEKSMSKRNSQILSIGFSYRFGKSGKKEEAEFKFEDSIP